MEEKENNPEDYEEIIRKKVIDELNSHFLFNALSYICAVEKRNPDRACELTKEFGDYLRGAMRTSACMGEWVLLSDELKPIRAFLHIQSLRFPGRLSYSIETEDEAAMVLAGSVRAFVEASVHAGILGAASVKKLSIRQISDVKKQTIIIEENETEDECGAVRRKSSIQERVIKCFGDTEDAAIRTELIDGQKRTEMIFPV